MLRRIASVAALVAATFVAFPLSAAAQCDGEGCMGPIEYVVHNHAELRNALQDVQAGDSIRFANDITLLGDLPNVRTAITIDGGGFALSGDHTYRGLFVGAFSGSSQ